jgi:L-ribulose-5-phosphate 3-epimerase
MNKIAFIQGRLVDTVDNQIQAFPRKDWINEFQLASRNNLNYIELTVDFNRIWENPVASSLGVEFLRKKLSENKLKAIACTADFIMHRPPWKEHLTKIAEISKKIINHLGQIGCKIIVIPFVDNSSINDDNEEDAVNFLLELKESLIKNNIQVAIESDFKPEKLLTFINQLPSDLYGINYDIGNSASLGYSIEEEFSLYLNRINHIHVKDRELNGSTVPLGHGNADLKNCFVLLKKYNYQGNFSLQTARDKSGNHVEVMLKYYDIVKEYLNGNFQEG